MGHTFIQFHGRQAIDRYGHGDKRSSDLVLNREFGASSATYGKKIKSTYSSVKIEHKNAGVIRVLFIKTKEQLIPIASTDLEISNEAIIDIYKRRWDIEQGYKELREHSEFGKEQNL